MLRPNAAYVKKELGFSNDTIKENPRVLTMSIKEMLRPNADYLKNELDFDNEAIKAKS